jgi:hypothetical protein
MQKYDEDLNTTLIFVSSARCSGVRVLTRVQAGLFSAVASAFIIEVHSHIQQDPNDVTAALLRVLLYKIDNTTFGNDPPALPQWAGPPRTIVHVQAILLASLAASLLSAFLAMLGKQWLNRYASTDMRGSAVERSQHRQRKLDGIITWYFNYVMEALPLILQIALLLLGCALSRYLWEINVTVASVVIGVTSFGMIFYIFVVVAGTISVICPYQTPGARILRHILHHILLLSAFRSTRSVISDLSALASSWFSGFIERSHCSRLAIRLRQRPRPLWRSGDSILIITHVLCLTLVLFAIALAKDAYTLGRLSPLVPLVYDRIIRGMRRCGKMVYHWFVPTSPAQIHSLDQQTIGLDLRCISWMLQTSLDKAVRLSALEHLATMVTLGNFDPTLVSGCFDVFIDHIIVDDNKRKVVTVQGSEQLAKVSAMCFLRTLYHLSVMDPTSTVLKDIRHRYTRIFHPRTPYGLPFQSTMSMIHVLAYEYWDPCHISWDWGSTSTQEWISFARGVAGIAQAKYQWTQKTPRRFLRFALDSLSQDSLTPTSVITDCLSIIAIDLGCDVSETGFTTTDERSVRISQMTTTLTLN